MDRDSIGAAILAAEEFLARAKAVLYESEWIVGTKETGALRRQSMELSRALSAMRRP